MAKSTRSREGKASEPESYSVEQVATLGRYFSIGQLTPDEIVFINPEGYTKLFNLAGIEKQLTTTTPAYKTKPNQVREILDLAKLSDERSRAEILAELEKYQPEIGQLRADKARLEGQLAGLEKVAGSLGLPQGRTLHDYMEEKLGSALKVDAGSLEPVVDAIQILYGALGIGQDGSSSRLGSIDSALDALSRYVKEAPTKTGQQEAAVKLEALSRSLADEALPALKAAATAAGQPAPASASAPPATTASVSPIVQAGTPQAPAEKKSWYEKIDLWRRAKPKEGGKDSEKKS